MADSDIITDAQIAAARAAGAKTLVRPRAVAARYLAGRDRIEIDLATGWSLQVPRSFSPRLAVATPEACAQLEIVDSGLGLHWKSLNEDWFVPAVVEAMTVVPAT